MAPATMKVILASALMAAALVIPASAQTGCTTALIGLAPCLSYISGNASTPSASCCSQLASVVQSQPQCLCTVLNGGGTTFGISINKTQALALPGACKVQTPPVSQCNSGGAGGAPASPAKTPNTAPSAPTTPSAESPSAIPAVPSSPSSDPVTPAAAAPANGSKSTSGDSSDGIMSKPEVSKILSAVIFASFITSLASFF